ncbi:unnamed protein product [Schistosoma curassoni]|uniref:Outer membrane protein n=1 Tax=Schistosoma curassoni TaxID=6186 RepID=A0A183L2L9_9TREM|nr:unnamed protein product [Schistosoma curassoni]
MSNSDTRNWGDDGVVGCYYQSSTNTVNIRAGYNDIAGKTTNFYNGPDEVSKLQFVIKFTNTHNLLNI